MIGAICRLKATGVLAGEFCAASGNAMRKAVRIRMTEGMPKANSVRQQIQTVHSSSFDLLTHLTLFTF